MQISYMHKMFMDHLDDAWDNSFHTLQSSAMKSIYYVNNFTL